MDDVIGTYSGDGNFETSTASATLIVAPTTTTVTVSPSSVALGQSVTYSATVAPVSGTGTPTGTVAFAIDKAPLCVATLSGGTGSCTASTAPLDGQGQGTNDGPDTVVGTYSGDASDTGSVGSVELSVGATTTAVSVQPGTAAQGQSVAYAATVTPTTGAGVPTGSVTFMVGATALCTASLSNGAASCVSTGAAVGNDRVVGLYSGDSQFAGSSGSATLAVGPTTTSLTASPSTVAFGQAVTYSAIVSSNLGTGVPTGSVTFTLGQGLLCFATLNNGTASCAAGSAPAGSDTVTATYSGAPAFASSIGSTSVDVGGTTTSVSVNPGTVSFGQSVTYTATVLATPGFAPPTGTVTFNAGTTTLCNAPVVGGSASCSSTGAPGGDDTVTGRYSGDASVGPSSGTSTLVVGPTSMTVSVNPSSVPAGANTTYAATVTPVLGQGTPTGTVSFSGGGYPLCSVSLSAGSASCTTVSNGGIGNDTITASYSGDSEFAGSSGSTTLTETRDPSHTVFSYNVLDGQSVAFSAIVQAVGPGGPAFAGTVTFSAGATTLCTAPFDGNEGQFTCTANNVPWGSDAIVATYGGDNFLLGSSSSLGLNLGRVSVVSVSSPAHVAPGQSVTYSATVTGAGTTTVPTGSVTISVGSTTLCVATLNAGSGSCSAQNAPSGTDAAAGTYSGDANFASSLGWTTIIVAVLPQTITFTSVPNSPVYGGTYTVSATGGVSGNPVTFTSATKTVCKVSASTVTLAAVGTCTIDANQAGNTLFTAAPQAQQSFVVAQAATTLVAVAEGPTSKAMKATLTRSFDGKPLGSQQVKFTIGGVTKCTAYTNASGVATCSLLGTRPAGSPTYVANYAGNKDYLSSSGSAPL